MPRTLRLGHFLSRYRIWIERGMYVYYSRKRPQDELPEEMTPIWSCSDENCKGWMRDNFVLSATPVCSLCQSEMVRGEKMLVALANTSALKIKD